MDMGDDDVSTSVMISTDGSDDIDGVNILAIDLFERLGI
jgi:hypothetical protein